MYDGSTHKGVRLRMSVTAGTMVGFTGVLVQRQHKPGHAYIQLVFRTANGVRLSATKNIEMVRGMVVGQTYVVEGREHRVGNKSFVHEPTTTLVRADAKKRKLRGFIIAGVVIAVIGIASVSVVFARSNDDKSKAEADTTGVSQGQGIITEKSGSVLGASTEDPSELNDTETPTPTPAPTPSPAPASRRSSPAVVAPPPAAAPSPAPAPTESVSPAGNTPQDASSNTNTNDTGGTGGTTENTGGTTVDDGAGTGSGANTGTDGSGDTGGV